MVKNKELTFSIIFLLAIVIFWIVAQTLQAKEPASLPYLEDDTIPSGAPYDDR